MNQKLWLVALVWLSCVSALGAETQSDRTPPLWLQQSSHPSSPGLWPLGLLVLAASVLWLVQQRQKERRQQDAQVQVVESHPLGKGKLALIEWQDAQLLLYIHEGGCTLLERRVRETGSEEGEEL